MYLWDHHLKQTGHQQEMIVNLTCVVDTLGDETPIDAVYATFAITPKS